MKTHYVKLADKPILRQEQDKCDKQQDDRFKIYKPMYLNRGWITGDFTKSSNR